jgi:DNA modification methylase
VSRVGKSTAASSVRAKSSKLRAVPQHEEARQGSAPVPKTEVKITSAKGRPMLVWVGKRPLSYVTAFPAQHVESFDLTGAFGNTPVNPALWKDWPTAYPKGGLLFHGDNKEVLAHLLANGFRSKVNLIYIDPPFGSGADYVRKVSLRGVKGTAKLNGERYTLGEQIQYTDIWANDNYLQFMYERLMLLKELMASDSTIYLHADPSKNYLLRSLMDEVFGQDCFTNEIVWWYWNKFQGNVNHFAMNHDTILCYRKGSPPFQKVLEEREEIVRQLKRAWDPVKGMLVNFRDEKGNIVYQDRAEKTVDDVWRISMLQPADETENLRFQTQKPEELLSVIWIGCDINKGAIQTTAKRLQGIIREQIAAVEEEKASNAQGKLLDMVEDKDDQNPEPAQLALTVWRVNDYDLAIQHNEAVNLACDHIGIERMRTDAYFDGTLGRSLVKIIPFGHPLTPLDLEELKRELDARPEEDRPLTVVCLGMELAAQAWIEDWNRLRKGKDAANRIEVIELRTDPKYGKFIAYEPARAKVKVARKKDKIVVEVEDFISPTILDRLKQQAGILAPKIDDWRAMVDCVMIDPAYNSQVFNVALSDVPEKKTDLVTGKYELPTPASETTVAVKIIDMLGGEVLITRTV